MSKDQAQRLIRRLAAEVNAHNTAGLVALYDDDATLTSPMFNTRTGRTSIAESWDLLFSGS